jgi:hypothetical protein
MPRFKEFPTIEIPPFLNGWEDFSWHNDACGKMEHPLVQGAEYPKLRLWVEEDSVSEREVIDFKYCLELIDAEEHECDGTAKVLYFGDIEADLRIKIAEVLHG